MERKSFILRVCFFTYTCHWHITQFPARKFFIIEFRKVSVECNGIETFLGLLNTYQKIHILENMKMNDFLRNREIVTNLMPGLTRPEITYYDTAMGPAVSEINFTATSW